MQCAGEQQRGQEPGHQHFGEVDAADDFLHLHLEDRIAQFRQPLDDQREHQRRGHHADGRRQADEAVVHVGEQGGQGNECRDEIEHDAGYSLSRR